MAITAPLYTVGVIISLGLAVHAWRKRRFKEGFPLPPGPSGLPLVGNIFDVNHSHPWLSYEQWTKQYGGLVYVNMLGMDFIIIGSAKVAHDLLDLRSPIYSGRPHMVANKLFGLDFNSGLLPYGSYWRLHRKLYNTTLNKATVHQYEPAAISKSNQLVENLLDSPEDYIDHFRTFATSVIMEVVYGYEIAPKNDPFVTTTEHYTDLFLTALTPEMAALLMVFPFLSYIPTWLPGGHFKRRAGECRLLAEEMLTGPFQWVVDSMAAGTAKDSLVSELLEGGNKADEEAIKAVASSSYLGGAETSNSTLRVFLLAMVLNPDIAIKAQEEIDRVVGTDRLPTFDDLPNLPYVEAIVFETYRWLPVSPDALPHTTASSDVYNGMYIPKGAIVIPSLWAIEHEETRFDDPMAFRPERYLRSDGMLLQDVKYGGFGYGRRACPGKHLAHQNIWAAIVTMLATLRLTKARDESGNEIEFKTVFARGLATHPERFPCSITPRSPSFEKLVRMRAKNGH